MTNDPSVWTLDRLQATVSELSIEQLLARYHQCVAGSHVWRPLDATAIGIRQAEWCGWCLKVRTRGFEGWLNSD